MTLSERQALMFVAAAPDGVTVELLRAHGHPRETLAELLASGLVTKTTERAKAGGQTIELVRVKITEAGKRALPGR